MYQDLKKNSITITPTTAIINTGIITSDTAQPSASSHIYVMDGNFVVPESEYTLSYTRYAKIPFLTLREVSIEFHPNAPSIGLEITIKRVFSIKDTTFNFREYDSLDKEDINRMYAERIMALTDAFSSIESTPTQSGVDDNSLYAPYPFI